jgi:hypothetical protein
MTQKLRYQILLDQGDLNKLQETLAEAGLNLRNESQIVQYAIKQFIHYETNIKNTIYAMKLQLEKYRNDIEIIETKYNAEKQEREKLYKENQLLKIEAEQIREKLKGGLKNVSTNKGKKK